MAHSDTLAPSVIGAVRPLFGRILDIGRSIAATLAAARYTELLLSQSDAELARRGLTRDQVVHHVFDKYLDHGRG